MTKEDRIVFLAMCSISINTIDDILSTYRNCIMGEEMEKKYESWKAIRKFMYDYFVANRKPLQLEIKDILEKEKGGDKNGKRRSETKDR